MALSGSPGSHSETEFKMSVVVYVVLTVVVFAVLGLVTKLVEGL